MVPCLKSSILWGRWVQLLVPTVVTSVGESFCKQMNCFYGVSPTECICTPHVVSSFPLLQACTEVVCWWYMKEAGLYSANYRWSDVTSNFCGHSSLKVMFLSSVSTSSSNPQKLLFDLTDMRRSKRLVDLPVGPAHQNLECWGKNLDQCLCIES